MSNVDRQKAASTGAIKADESAAAASYVTSIDKEPTKGFLLAKIYTPFTTYFEGDAKSITALNESGWFDVLPGHHNFISMLLPCKLEVKAADDEKKVIPIQRGLMHVREDRLIIFLDV